MKTVADMLTAAHAGLGDLEKAMRGAIVNQNISDIVANARAKLSQAAEHPDASTELSALEPKIDERNPPLDFKGDGASFPNPGNIVPTGE